MSPRHLRGLCAVLGCVVLAATLGAQQRDTGQFVAIGCVSAVPAPNGRGDAAAVYIITDARGEKPLIFRLDGDPAKLKIHVGHTLEIAGTVSPGSPTAKGPHASAPLMKVQRITWIASRCQPAKPAQKE